jgi:hypothetical protein
MSLKKINILQTRDAIFFSASIPHYCGWHENASARLLGDILWRMMKTEKCEKKKN